MSVSVGSSSFSWASISISSPSLQKNSKMSTPSEGSNKKDPAWQYAHLENPQNNNRFKCNFCGKISNGGVYRVKQHLAGGYKNVTACPKCPAEVREEIREYMTKKKAEKEEMNMLPHFDELANAFDEDEDDDVEVIGRGKRPLAHRTQVSSAHGSTTMSTGSKPKKPKQKGPIDVFFTPNPDAVVQNRKAQGKQTRIDENDPYRKELRERACLRFARWMYDVGIPFNAVNYDSFGPMIEAIGQYGLGMKPPSYHEVRVPLLKKEIEHTNNLMKSHREDWVKYGCSIMVDGWTDKKGRTLLNFLVNCPKGTMFVESIDASSYSKDAEKMFQLIDKFVERIGEANVVQVVTDSAAANVLAGKFLEAKFAHLYWTPCAAHCLDLMLEDIFKIPSLKRTFERGIAVHGFIYNRPTLLNMMRRFTQIKDLIKPAKTRFATAFLTLARIHQQKNNLRKMFTSEEWTTSKWAKEQQGKRVAQIMLMPSFWNTVVYALKVSGPLLCVLRLVDGEKKPPMGYIYEAMDRAKEAISNAFGGKEERYNNIFEIINRRWDVQLHRPLHATGYFLNPAFFYSNPNIEQDNEVMTGLYNCISKLVPNIDVQDKISQELSIYKKAENLFGLPMAVRQRATTAPAEWWAAYGSKTPYLQKFAIKVLSLTCSSSGCERNWSVFEHPSLSLGLFEGQRCELQRLSMDKGKSSQFVSGMLKAKGKLLKRGLILFAASEDQTPNDELNSIVSEREDPFVIANEISAERGSNFHTEKSDGKPGLISFYGLSYRRQDDVLVSDPPKGQSNFFWFIGPAVLVASLVFPSLYLRRILSTVFEDSLLTDFLILFFTEALFYSGVAIFVLITDHMQKPRRTVISVSNSLSKAGIGHRISSVATLVLSLIIPLVTMGLVWPWTGPAASATLAPYLVGLIVQFAFEQYARYRKSVAWPVIPVIFQVYRLHQLNRAAQLVTALSFSVRGAETTSQTMAINSSLGTLLNVLHFLGVICIWSLSSFLMRFFPSAVIPDS